MEENNRYEIVEDYGTIGYKYGENGELNPIKVTKENWYGNEAFAIRSYYGENNTKPGRGITLNTVKEVRELKDVLNKIDMNDFEIIRHSGMYLRHV